MIAHEARLVLDFWFGDTLQPRSAWFVKNPQFDAEIGRRFGDLQTFAAAGGAEHWCETALGALALLVLLDQFPRNLFRGQAAAFACDAAARRVAADALRRGHDQLLAPVQRWFLYLPFEHSEDLADQERSVALFQTLQHDPATVGTLDYAERHRDVIQRFGRFPHRNAALGRVNTDAEAVYLAQPGAGF